MSKVSASVQCCFRICAPESVAKMLKTADKSNVIKQPKREASLEKIKHAMPTRIKTACLPHPFYKSKFAVLTRSFNVGKVKMQNPSSQAAFLENFLTIQHRSQDSPIKRFMIKGQRHSWKYKGRSSPSLASATREKSDCNLGLGDVKL